MIDATKQPQLNLKKMVNASMKTLQHMLITNGIKHIGRQNKKQTHKPYITDEILKLIKELRVERKKLSCIFNRLRKLKQSNTTTLTTELIKQDIGPKAFQRWKNLKMRQQYKQQLIRKVRRKWQNHKIMKLTQQKNKVRYQVLNQIEQVAHGKHDHINGSSNLK